MDSVVCYHLTAAAGRPVKMVMTYTEELLAGNPRHPAIITLRTGADANGRIVARKARLVFSCGAYSAFTPLHTVHGSVHAAGPYRMPNVEIEVPAGLYQHRSCRAYARTGRTPDRFLESRVDMDLIAQELGLDPLEFRLRNTLVEGDAAPLG